MVDLGYQRAYMRCDGSVVGILEERPFRRHRPGRPGGANIRESLFDADRPLRALDDENKIEIPIAHFAHLPMIRPSAEHRPNGFEACEQRRQAARIEYRVGRDYSFIRHHQIPYPSDRTGISTPPKNRPESVASCLP